MTCPFCNCRLVSRARNGSVSLICSNCSHPLDDYLQRQKPRWNWKDRGILALALSIGICGFGVIAVSEALGGAEGMHAAPEADQLERSDQ